MKKKLLGLFMLVMCVVLSLGVLAACNNTPEKPEGGSWTCYSENKIWTKILTLKFEDSETFKVYSGSDQWIKGKYKFAKDPGTSTLTLWNADVAIPGVEKDGEKTYEPVDGVYTIEFDHGSGGKSKFLFQPPQDGTKPGEETNQPKPPCDTHVDANKDGKCDECGADMPKEEAKVQVAMTAKASVEIPNVMTVNAEAKIEIYDDNTWVMYIKTDADPTNLDYQKAASGTYTNTQTEMTLTRTELTVQGSEMAEAINVSVDPTGYPTIAYSATVTYTNVMAFEFSFTGTMNMQ